MNKRKPAGRRQFLQTSLLAAAGIALGTSCANNATEKEDAAADTTAAKDVTSQRAIGLQLYTIPHLLQKDFPGTLKTIADIGYRELEFAGPYNFSADSTINSWKAYA